MARGQRGAPPRLHIRAVARGALTVESHMAEEYVIPPGQEEVLGAMLGKDGGLPGNCTLGTGDVQKTVVSATYACPKGAVVVELTHPDVAAAGATRTEKFAVRIESGTPPPDFQNALLA